jgi:hypothetical protein
MSLWKRTFHLEGESLARAKEGKNLAQRVSRRTRAS